MKQRLVAMTGEGAWRLAFTALRAKQGFERLYKKKPDGTNMISYALCGILEMYNFAFDPRMLEVVRAHGQDAV